MTVFTHCIHVLEWIEHGLTSPPTQSLVQRKTQKKQKNTKYTYTYKIVHNKEQTHIIKRDTYKEQQVP